MVLQNDAKSLRLLSSLQEKKERLLAMGVDRVEVLDFTRDFSSLTASEYLSDVLVGRFGATAIVLGYDNRMGSDGLTHDGVAALAGSMGLDVYDVDAFSLDSTIPDGMATVSSTKVRTLLENGDVASASAMLGYRYSLHGVVVAGNQFGRTMGYPTANMQLYEPLKLVPSNGVYLVEVETLGGHWYGMTNIGVRPTVSGSGARTIETHIFGFDDMIYGLDIRIRFISRIREELRFASVEALKDQLAEDERQCLSMLAEN